MFRFQTRMYRPEQPMIMRGKTVVITGANTGLGLAAAQELARYGGRVILACRNTEKAEQARKSIIDLLKPQAEHKDIEERVVVKKLDLASLTSVRAFAEDVIKTESRLDVLVNNAGLAGYGERTLTEDGLEITMASNHYGHFLLTCLLVPLLKKSAPSRIVIVSSWGHTLEKTLDLENMNCEKYFDKMRIYQVTKLCNVMMGRKLGKLLEGSNVVANSLGPGFVDTEVFRNIPKWAMFLMSPIWLFAKTPVQGAQTTIFLSASTSPEANVTGRYFSNCKEAQMGEPAKDDALVDRMWEISEQLVKLKPEERVTAVPQKSNL